jgi:hypothetical protein
MRHSLGIIVLAPLILAGSCAHRASAQVPARRLLEQAISASGGEAKLGAYRALEWRGRATISLPIKDLHLTGLWRLLPPDSAVVTLRVDGQDTASRRRLIIAGDRGWSETGGATRPLPPEAIAHERNQFYLYYLMRLVPLRAPEYRLTALAPDSLGHPGFRVSHPGRPDVAMYFNENGHLVRMIDDIADPNTHGPVRQEVECTGEVAGAGIHWPRRITIRWDGLPYFEVEILEFRLLAELADSALAGPRR